MRKYKALFLKVEEQRRNGIPIAAACEKLKMPLATYYYYRRSTQNKAAKIMEPKSAAGSLGDGVLIFVPKMYLRAVLDLMVKKLE